MSYPFYNNVYRNAKNTVLININQTEITNVFFKNKIYSIKTIILLTNN